MRLIKRLIDYFNYLTSGQPASLTTNTGTTQPAPPSRPAAPPRPQTVQTNGHRRPPAVAPLRPAPLTTILGTDMRTGLDISITQKAKAQGAYIIGENGTGKSTLVENMLVSDILEGLGVGVVEPHGDLTTRILARIPRHRQHDVIYLDVEDWQNVFGLSLFEVPEPRNIRTEAAVASFVSHVFETLWNSGFDTPRLMQNLRAVTRTLIANPGSTFSDIPLLYTSEETRARMLANVTSPQVLAFWEEYEHMNFRDRRAFCESTLNKVTAFLDEPMIQHIVCQSKTSIDFRSIMDNSKILLIKLSPQFEQASKLIGSIVIGRLLMNAFSRSDVPPEQRRAFNLYVDEFQRFQSGDLATFISEARKWNISTCLSHQTLAQLTEQNRASALAAGTIICFRVSGLDAPVLARSYDMTPTQTIVGEEPIKAPVADVVSHLLRHGSPHPPVQKFVSAYLIPLDALTRYIATMMGHSLDIGPLSIRHLHVTQARGLLNETLATCMRTSRSDLFLEPLLLLILGAAAGTGIPWVFKNHCKRNFPELGEFNGFRTSARQFGEPHFLENTQALNALAQRHATKTVHSQSAGHNIHQTPGPSFIDMLTLLRQTMAVLAKGPILVDTGQFQPKYQMRTYADMEGEIANSLANQENYHAKVKIVNAGEFTVKTRPAPDGLTGDALTERIQAVKRHMRALGYTRHYTEVMEELRKRQEQLLGLGNTPDEDEDSDGDGPDEPPPGSFTID